MELKGTSGNWMKRSGSLRKKLQSKSMMFTMRAMKTYPTAQPLGFFDVKLRVQWLEGSP